MLVTCNHCQTRVLPKEDGNCPSCGRTIDPNATLLPERPRPTALTAGRRYLDVVAFRAKAGIVFGLFLSGLAAFGKTYQWRENQPVFEGMRLFWAGLGISGFSIILYLLCRRKKS